MKEPDWLKYAPSFGLFQVDMIYDAHFNSLVTEVSELNIEKLSTDNGMSSEVVTLARDLLA
jgi:hypothetical protein